MGLAVFVDRFAAVDVGQVRGSQALARILEYPDVGSVLDVGSGAGQHARMIRATGRSAFTVDLTGPAGYVGDFMTWQGGIGEYDAVWASHVLEHQPNPGQFLVECRRRLRPGGVLAVTVPPMKDAVVGGHLAMWNAGVLLYHMILAGFDCRDARVGTYASGPDYPPYNISALVRAPVAPLRLPALRMDAGDIETLAPYFPLPVVQGFDGRLPDLNW